MFKQLNKSIIGPSGSTENTGNENVFMTHPSVRIKGTELEWTAAICRESCGESTSKGQHMHCPFCPVKSVFTDPFLLRAHYRVKHVDKGVDFAGLRILRCSNECFVKGVIKEEKKFKGAHWHCFRCKNAFNRKDEAVKHFKTHFRNPATTFQIQIAKDINQPNILEMYNKQAAPTSFRTFPKPQHGIQSYIHYHTAEVEVDKQQYIISEVQKGPVENNDEIVLITSEEREGLGKAQEIIEELQKQVNILQEEKDDMEKQFQHKIEVLNEEKKLLRQQLTSLQQGILSKMPASVLLESQFIARNLEQQFKDFVQFNMSKLSQCFLSMASTEMTVNNVESNQAELYNVTIQSHGTAQEFVSADVTSNELVQNVIAAQNYVNIDGVTTQVIEESDVNNLESNANTCISSQGINGVIRPQELIIENVLKNNPVEASHEFEENAIVGSQEQHDLSIVEVPVEQQDSDGNSIDPSCCVTNGDVQYITATEEGIIDVNVINNSSIASGQFQLSIKASEHLNDQSILQKRILQGKESPPLTIKRGKMN